MKKIYMIYERDYGSRHIFFENEKDAQEYCDLHNDTYNVDSEAHYDYYVKEADLYDSMDEYKNKDIKSHLRYLKDAVDELTKSILKVKSENHSFTIRFKDGFHITLYMDDLKEMLLKIKEGKFNAKEYRAETYGYETYIGTWHSGESRNLTKKDLPEIVKGYKKIKSDIKNMENRLKRYMKEYVELSQSEKVKDETLENEKELTK